MTLRVAKTRKRKLKIQSRLERIRAWEREARGQVNIPEDDGAEGTEEKRQSDGGGNVVGQLVEGVREACDREGDGEEVPGVNGPSEPTREEHGALERGEHHGELDGVKRSAIAGDPSLLLGGELEKTVGGVNHCGVCM